MRFCEANVRFVRTLDSEWEMRMTLAENAVYLRRVLQGLL